MTRNNRYQNDQNKDGDDDDYDHGTFIENFLSTFNKNDQ